MQFYRKFLYLSERWYWRPLYVLENVFGERKVFCGLPQLFSLCMNMTDEADPTRMCFFLVKKKSCVLLRLSPRNWLFFTQIRTHKHICGNTPASPIFTVVDAIPTEMNSRKYYGQKEKSLNPFHQLSMLLSCQKWYRCFFSRLVQCESHKSCKWHPS